MRGKIIAVFTVVVLVVGVLEYALTRATLGDLSTSGDASRALATASAKLQLDGLLLERWLITQANDAKSRNPFNAGTANARAESASEFCNRVRDGASSAPELSGMAVALVVLIDKNGVVLGRNGSGLMRGDDLGALYPSLKAALAKGTSGSDVWVNRGRNEQLLASYAPIRGANGDVLGGLAVGTAFNDERLTDASERTSGRILVAAVRDGDKLDVVAKSSGATTELVSAVASTPAKDSAIQALTSGQVVDISGLPHDFTGAARALDGYGDGRRAVLIGVARLQAPGLTTALVWPSLGVTLLGLVLVAAGAYFLDAYISRPVSEIEEGLLAIMNGRTDLRFEIEHAELGGLVFRLNSLLNQLLGVQEDETDAEGRVSRAPTANAFEDALSVDERMTAESGGDSGIARRLREEPDDVYYARIYAEYIQAKTSLGDPIDHITKEAFIGRIMASERELAHKHGKPVRYTVEVRGKEVVLLAVPLA